MTTSESSAAAAVAPPPARWMFVGTPVIFLMWLTTSMSRGVGDAVTPLRTLCLAAVIAMAATPAFIRGAYWLNATIGITGIGWSYAAAFVAMFLFQATYFRLGWRGRTHRWLI